MACAPTRPPTHVLLVNYTLSCLRPHATQLEEVWAKMGLNPGTTFRTWMADNMGNCGVASQADLDKKLALGSNGVSLQLRELGPKELTPGWIPDNPTPHEDITGQLVSGRGGGVGWGGQGCGWVERCCTVYRCWLAQARIRAIREPFLLPMLGEMRPGSHLHCGLPAQRWWRAGSKTRSSWSHLR